MLQGEEFEKALSRSGNKLQAGAALESILSELREIGADKIDSIKIVKSLMDVSMAQAKHLVDCSETWDDRFEHDRAFQASVRIAAEELRLNTDIEVMIEDRDVDPKP